MEGWVKIHRCITDNPFWLDKPYSKGQAWIDLILLANFKPRKLIIKGKIKEIQRGSLLTSEMKLCERWGWSRKKVRNFLKLLESEEMITVKGTAEGTAITIVKYEFYQAEGTAEDTIEDTIEGTAEEQQRVQQRDSRGTTEGTQKKKERIEKNRKNEKKERKEEKKENPVYFPQDEKLNSSFRDFIEYRKSIKSPMTDIAIAKAISKLQELSTVNGVMDNDLAIKIIDQSIVNGWKGLFRLQEKNQPKKQGEDWESWFRWAEEKDREIAERRNNDGQGNYGDNAGT